MATSTLLTHCGAREVTLDELKALPPPVPLGPKHFPIPFARVLEITVDNLLSSGFEVTCQRIALQRDNGRFFATLDTKSVLVSGTTLSVAIRSSHDASLSYAFVAGNRTFCCDNLALSSDLSLFVRRKHTRNGADCFASAMARVIREKLPHFARNEALRLKKFQLLELPMEKAESLILRSHETGLLSARHLLPVLKEFRSPRFEEFTEHGLSYWRLENAYSTCLGDMARRMPQRYAGVSIGIQGLLSEAASIRPDEAQAQVPA